MKVNIDFTHKMYSITFHQKFESDQFDVEVTKRAAIKQNFK